MQFNERKMQTLEIFARYEELRPPQWAVAAGFYSNKSELL